MHNLAVGGGFSCAKSDLVYEQIALVVVVIQDHVMVNSGYNSVCCHGDAGCTPEAGYSSWHPFSLTLCGFDARLCRLWSYSCRYHVRTWFNPI